MYTIKNLSNWKSHNLLSFIEDNNLIEFTVDELVNEITNEQYLRNWCTTHVNKLCLELLNAGYFSAKYKTLGTKTVTMYKYIRRASNKVTPETAIKKLQKYIDDDNVLNVYVFGSHVYESTTPESDIDCILVVKEYFDSKDIDVHVYTSAQFQLLLKRHDIQALECLFAPRQWVLKEECVFVLHNIDKSALRTSISTITSNSWVKGKKKLTVAGDYDLHLALKSIFHSLRILDYGIQIASCGKIQTFTSMNFVLDDIKKMSTEFQREELWQKIDDKYRKLFNSKSSEFKILAPKDLTERTTKTQLETILKKYNIADIELTNELLNLFQK